MRDLAPDILRQRLLGRRFLLCCKTESDPPLRLEYEIGRIAPFDEHHRDRSIRHLRRPAMQMAIALAGLAHVGECDARPLDEIASHGELAPPRTVVARDVGAPAFLLKEQIRRPPVIGW